MQLTMAHLFEPLKRIVGKVITLCMGQDVLGQGRPDSLEILTFGGSHDQENWSKKDGEA